jgi:hypothetical protein
MRSLIGAGVLVALAFVIRFEPSVPIGLDIYIHNTCIPHGKQKTATTCQKD